MVALACRFLYLPSAMKWLEFILFQCFKWFVLALPLKSAQRLGYYLGGIAYHIAVRRRNIALENLRYAFPEKSDEERTKITRGAFRNFAIAFVELLWFPNMTGDLLRKLVRIRNLGLITDTYRLNRGLILLTGHFGNWELHAIAVGYQTGLPLTIIVQTQSNGFVDAVINNHRMLFGNRVVPRGSSIREIIRTLQNRGVIAIAADQSGPEEGPYVEFFGRKVSAHQGPAAFALKGRTPMLFGIMLRQPDGTYEVSFEEVPYADLKEYNEQTMFELTQRYTTLLEQYIRRYPDHWLWLHRRWKHVRQDDTPHNRSGRSAVGRMRDVGTGE